MMNKIMAASAVLGLTVAIAFGTPKIKYTNQRAFQFQMPRLADWQSRDVSRTLNLGDARYKFVSKVTAYQILSDLGENFLFLVLDAANFHHPRVCFNGAGYKVKQLEDISFDLKNHRFKAHAVYAGKDGDGFLVLYWITIDQKQVNWTEQKLKQLWFSLFNKERVGLMVRLDIPARAGQIDTSLRLAKEFLTSLETQIPAEKSDYLFGK